MPSVTDFDTVEFRQLLDRLSAKASDDYYNPYVTFEWPDELPPDVLWMTPELLSVWGTAVFDELDEAALVRLSRFESVNFYSLNVHGIRELLIEVTRRVHSPGFEIPSDFFHHFIGEENEHMWFFATFCTRYGGKIYTDKTLPLTGTQRPAGRTSWSSPASWCSSRSSTTTTRRWPKTPASIPRCATSIASIIKTSHATSPSAAASSNCSGIR